MSAFKETAGGVLIRVKAVPGARREQIAGLLGDRLKVKIAQPPEGGKANAAICGLLAQKLGVNASAVSLVSGHANPEKVVRVEGVTPERAREALTPG